MGTTFFASPLQSSKLKVTAGAVILAATIGWNDTTTRWQTADTLAFASGWKNPPFLMVCRPESVAMFPDPGIAPTWRVTHRRFVIVTEFDSGCGGEFSKEPHHQRRQLPSRKPGFFRA